MKIAVSTKTLLMVKRIGKIVEEDINYSSVARVGWTERSEVQPFLSNHSCPITPGPYAG